MLVSSWSGPPHPILLKYTRTKRTFTERTVVAFSNHKEELVGRDRIVMTVLDHFHNARSAFLVGAAGIGKTAILHAAVNRARGLGGARTPIYCGQTSTLKITLRCMAEALLAQDADWPTLGPRDAPISSDRPLTLPRNLGRLSIGKLRRIVVPRLKSGRYTLLLDHVTPVRAAKSVFLEYLVESLGIPIVAAVRSLHPQEIGWLWWVGLSFAKIEVPALRPAEARRLIEQMLDRGGASLPDRESFVNGLLSRAHGNPRVIVRVCGLARSPRYQTGGRTNFRLLLLDLKIRDLQDQIEVDARLPLRGPVSQ